MPRKILQAAELFDRPHGQGIVWPAMIMCQFKDEVGESTIKFGIGSFHYRQSLYACLFPVPLPV
ncbi:hypothetical protein CS379_09530 [Methylobacterium frigidaeris]|nr:hypothetical protein CS379_09530 [Methylobacterium frigidaeris]